MEMKSLNISLPADMKQFIENKTSAGGYGTASEYIRELVRADQKKEAEHNAVEEKVVAMLLEGVRQLDRGERIDGKAFLDELRCELTERHAKKAG
jgi:antitoxin ParD1/3/4